ncbi:hypothetical protein C0J52_00819 [Blattella germanica]|nr:hypothetical protein C0J52_00819 [Blattella germanica]
MYYSVGDYGFPQPVRIKPPCPDIIPTQRILPRKSRFKSNVEKLPETDICPQATTVDTAPVPTKLVLDDLELKEELQMESEASLLQVRTLCIN